LRAGHLKEITPLATTKFIMIAGRERMVSFLDTRRLSLRPLELADAEQTPRWFPHWEIVKFLANRIPWPYPADGALTHYRDDVLPAMARGERWT
jgi:[ribosomal protein S5]-alanine N-acetyltransferase